MCTQAGKHLFPVDSAELDLFLNVRLLLLQESKFWKFLLKDVSVAAWSYVVWILLRKCIFAVRSQEFTFQNALS